MLLAIQVVRNAAVEQLAALHPEAAAKLWRGHPAVEISLGLANVGNAAREQRPINPGTFAMIDDAAAKAPLSSEPFLVRGVQAQLAGNFRSALQAFTAAQWRDPRSLPAAYFLADYYFRTGRPLQGLVQTAILAKLSPQGGDTIAPFLATYARDRANWPQIRALFRSQEALQDSVLSALAREAGNADAVLAIAGPSYRRADSPWVPVLLSSLAANGNYQRAHDIWASVAHVRPQAAALLFDGDFTQAAPPPPFNWTLTTSTVGLAERQTGKGLHVIFYGNQEGVLASQLLLLRPGMYQLKLQISGGPASDALRWSIRCDKASQPIATVTLREAASRGWAFGVPDRCAAQWLELSGRSGDIAEQADVSIDRLFLTRAGSDG